MLNPLNPDAGQVPVPTDPREVDAALAAGPTTLRLFPYVEWRYGERGRRFSQSDSAWLAWLVQHPRAHVIEQVLWLRGVLSNRGMPGLLLETHLRVLARHLGRAVPERTSRYRKLEAASDHLLEIRRSRLAEEVERRLVERLADAIERPRDGLVVGAGRLLVSSIVDECDGVRNASSSAAAWLCDPDSLRGSTRLRAALTPDARATLDDESFPTAWREATAQLLGEARENVRH